MCTSRSFPTSLLLLLLSFLLLPQQTRAEIQKLYQEQLQILEQRLQENQNAQRLNPHNTRLKREAEDIRIAILSLQRQMLREQQREQERQQREQERQERRQATLTHLQDLLYLQEKELERLLEEYQQIKSLYPLGLVPEHHWHRIQRQVNMQKERVRRTQTRIQELSP
jgi:hypothetical protein